MNKHFSVGLIFFLGITLSIVTYWTVKHQLNTHRNLEFQWTASEHYRAFHKQLKNDLNALVVHKLLDVFQLEKPNDFKTFSRLILNQHKSIKSLYWLPADSSTLSSDKTTADKTKAASLLFSAIPKDESLHALSQDQHFVDNFNDFVKRVHRTRKLSITEPIAIKNGNQIELGIIGLLAVYPIAKQQSQAKPSGYVMGILILSDLFKVSIGHLQPRGIDIYLLNKSAAKEKQLLYYYKSRIPRDEKLSNNENLSHSIMDISNKNSNNNILRLEKNLSIADHNWLFIAKATPQFRSVEAFTQGPLIALAIGIFFTLFVVLFFYNLSLAKEAWQAAERKLHIVLDQSPDYIIILDKNASILYMNKSLFGLQHNTAIGRHLYHWLPTEYHQRYRKGLNSAFKQETTDIFNYSLADFSHWEVRIIPIRTKNKVSSAMVINTDVSKQHKLQSQTTENARLASIGVLATGIAHEINNPNNSIYYNASLVKDAWQDIIPVLNEYQQENGDFSMAGLPYSEVKEKVSEAYSNIIDHTTRIKKIVANLKSFARKDSGKINEDVQIVDVISDALLIINNEIHKHTNKLSLEIPDKLPIVKGNAQKLEQVFINIILNALHSLPSKDKAIQLFAKYDKNKNNNIFSVHDQGIGIDPDSINKITQPFYTTKPNHIGTGLGLSISKSIIEEHRGKLMIESKLNQGTTVTIIIPVETYNNINN